jgi:hypothetical protein
MKYYLLGVAVGVVVEILAWFSQMDNEEPAEPEEGEHTYSISNGTIFKALAGFGLIEWLLGRKKE